MDVPVLVDKKLSIAVTKEAIAKGEVGLASPRSQAAIAAARRVITRGKHFTTDDVWLELGWVPDSQSEASFMGSVMRHLSQGGEIIWTGTYRPCNRPQQHRNPIKVWRPNWAAVPSGYVMSEQSGNV